MNVLSLACAIHYDILEDDISLTTKQCGFSHNVLNMQRMNFSRGTMVPARDIGICVRPFSIPNHADPEIFYNNFALWLEYLRHIGADKVHLYINEVKPQMKRILDFYEQETFSILSTVQWSNVSESTEQVVSDEAAVNHCIYQNMATYEYILTLSLNEWLVFSGKFENLKQLVRNEDFEAKMAAYGGYRIRSAFENERQMYIVKPKLFLGSAARHFIALTGRPSFHVLETIDVMGVRYADRRLSQTFKNAENKLTDLVKSKTSTLL